MKQHRYNALDYHLKTKYGKKVFKISLNGNFTCPNRTGQWAPAAAFSAARKEAAISPVPDTNR